MRVLHYATRTVATLALALAAGCGKDSTAPDAPFDPAGTSADVAAVGESFDSPALAAYGSAAGSISAVVGGSAAVAVSAAPSRALLDGSRAGAARYAATLSRNYLRAGLRPSSSGMAAAEIPAQYLGVTFVWDVETDSYVASELAGAPEDGVRFVLYAVNPITGMPVEPLVPIDGYADITASETSTSSTVQVTVVSAGITWLDYNVHANAGVSSADVTVSGFATNGNDRVEFDLGNELSGSESSGFSMATDYELVVPTRGGFLLDLEATFTGLLTDTPSTTLDLLARGEHGTVRIQGSATDASGSFQVRVNGDLFATITVDGTGTATITGANGQPLSENEYDALEGVFGMFANGLDFMEDLMDPVS